MSTKSLDDFFTPAGPSRKKDGRRKGGKTNANANSDSYSQDELEPEGDAREAVSREAGADRDRMIVESVSANIEEMLDRKLADVIKSVGEVAGKLDGLIERMGTVEQRVSDLEDSSATVTPRVEALETQVQKTLERLENFENQSRRQNVRIVGLKEGTEGRSPVDFFEKWIPDVLNLQNDRIQIERAHRTGARTGRAGREGPRAVLVRLHSYTDRQRILYAARDKGVIKVDRGSVSFYQDFSMEVVRRRKESANARRLLREAGIRYSFLYPAVIKISHPDGSSSAFSTVGEINDYVNTLPSSK